MASTGKNNLLHINTGILPKDACIVLVKTEWNAAIVDQLERGCIAALEKNGVQKIIVLTVPGAVEITFAIKNYWETSTKKNKPLAFVALGCVIKGDTPHFDYVCKAVTDGVLQLNLLLPVPTIFGVLTVNDEQQAIERIGGKHGHKGEEAGLTVIKMVNMNHKPQKEHKKLKY